MEEYMFERHCRRIFFFVRSQFPSVHLLKPYIPSLYGPSKDRKLSIMFSREF